jgi:hypothetical protein
VCWLIGALIYLALMVITLALFAINKREDD